MSVDSNEIKEILSQYKEIEGISDEDARLIEHVATGQDQLPIPIAITTEEQALASTYKGFGTAVKEPQEPEHAKDIRILIAAMSLPQKIKTALYGNATCRLILIRDANKVIQICVLKNPKLTLPEVEDFAKSTHISDLILRTIANSSVWMRSYHLKYNIVTNPKTPGDIALKWLRHLNVPELRRISKSKNVPQVIAISAKKRLNDMERNKT